MLYFMLFNIKYLDIAILRKSSRNFFRGSSSFPFNIERRDLKMSEEKKIAGIYIRVSTEDQVRERI